MINLMNPVERNFYGVPAIFVEELLSEGKEIDFDDESETFIVFDKFGNGIMEFEQFISDELMMNIVSYMDDDIREEIHSKFAPCSNEKFIEEYCNIDYVFRDLLKEEFNIDYL